VGTGAAGSDAVIEFPGYEFGAPRASVLTLLFKALITPSKT
jgi:hypothetical protein